MTVRDFLQRFRPAGAPGAATRAGVPADRVAELTAELAPVFALLAEVEAEAAGIRQEAVALAEARRAEAARTADRLVAEARLQAQAARAAAFTAARAHASVAAAATVAGAEEEADRVHQRAAARLPRLVPLAVDRLLADLATTRREGAGPAGVA